MKRGWFGRKVVLGGKVDETQPFVSKGIDFGALLAGRRATKPTEPEKLYEALSGKAPGYGYLRLVQGQVLSQWQARRVERDVVIKVNTGGGKTIDGLIILQSQLNAGNGPALYVAPDNNLAQQVVREAGRLGLQTVTDPDDGEYLRSEAICVINAYKLVNGRSVFSNSRSPKSPAPIGSVVIDDAHAAIATTRDQLSIRIPSSSPAFTALLNLFAPDLSTYSPNTYLDVLEGAYGALARVPFWSWRHNLEAVRRVLRQHAESEPLRFALPVVQDALPFSRAVFSGDHLTITPFCPPIQHISMFLQARHRVYLTATLADDGVLVTDFDANVASVENPVTPSTASDIGERMILVPQDLNPAITAPEFRSAMKDLSASHNVVVLVPSDKVGQMWEPYADRIVNATDISEAVDSLKDGASSTQLVVIVNRYDGIDLPGDACRVLVIDGLPEAFSAEQRLEASLTSRSTGTDDRQIQRIEQGMGRAVRSNEDHCVVFLFGPRLSQLVNHPDAVARFGPATRAQIALSHDFSRSLRGASLADILAVAEQSLSRDPGWVELAKESISGLEPQPGRVAVSSVARRRAFDTAFGGDSIGAAQILGSAAEDPELDDRTRGWLLEQQAALLDLTDPEAAQAILKVARAQNSDVLRPLVSSPYTPLVPQGGQSERAAGVLRQFSTATDLVLAFEAMLADLVFDQSRTEQFEAAFEKAGKLIGLVTERPEKSRGDGPDCLWALDSRSYWVIEAKSGATTNFVAKKDVNQLAGSANWFHENYVHGEAGVPVMVHRSRVLGEGATAVPGMRFVTERLLSDLKINLKAFAAALGTSDWTDAMTIDQLLRGHKLMAEDLSQYLTGVA